ncbi:hypothetical protein LEP48_05810 [Isoptericola sp. NEAU-Y5]|uniref:Asparagine synthetase domain-containing protein n=1 Tax=Isoptericola luteus TaxID=2879484 RepID=A0ABS7ZCV2_9MICO|nr:asparagine synthase-related protein [Isoptericola sp. NEAU-Y5]MCA5892870.1 hypothetical protein [Isoptericola sp. NEAU-Y5]
MAWSWLPGVEPDAAVRAVPRDPLDVLTDVLAPHLIEGPCFVAFSGGRDSSAVLAAAVRAARTLGAPDPVPVTLTYPGLPATDESDWQELVVRHLGLTRWLRLDATGQTEILGPSARESLSRRGLLWPATMHTKDFLLSRIGPGTLLTGEGGDEVFSANRVRPFAELASHRRPDSDLARRCARALLPRGARAAREAGALAHVAQPWVHAEVQRDLHHRIAADNATEPLAWHRALGWVRGRRVASVLAATHSAIGREHGVDVVAPLLDRGFLGALVARHRTLGYPSRRAAMHEVFGSVLPRSVVERTTKAYFNHAYLADATRTFAQQWDGSGVDEALVDPALLRAEWLAPTPSGLSSLLLQQAWLASTSTSPR